MKKVLVQTSGKGFFEITDNLKDYVHACSEQSGLCHVFIAHTSASLIIMENADPTARKDLQMWMDEIVPENHPKFVHKLEGPDDMPSHIKMVLTQTQISVPFENHELALGPWQGVFVWEHRKKAHQRSVVLSLSPTI